MLCPLFQFYVWSDSEHELLAENLELSDQDVFCETVHVLPHLHHRPGKAITNVSKQILVEVD
jgi:hypothetical protein